MILVTGSAGLSAQPRSDWFARHDEAVVGPDKLTYAGNLENPPLKDDPRHILCAAISAMQN
jgi:dTDP-glucose 4,6-dehydratase